MLLIYTQLLDLTGVTFPLEYKAAAPPGLRCKWATANLLLGPQPSPPSPPANPFFNGGAISAEVAPAAATATAGQLPIVLPEHLAALLATPGCTLDLGEQPWADLPHSQIVAALYTFVRSQPRLLVTNAPTPRQLARRISHLPVSARSSTFALNGLPTASGALGHCNLLGATSSFGRGKGLNSATCAGTAGSRSFLSTCADGRGGVDVDPTIARILHARSCASSPGLPLESPGRLPADCAAGATATARGIPPWTRHPTGGARSPCAASMPHLPPAYEHQPLLEPSPDQASVPQPPQEAAPNASGAAADGMPISSGLPNCLPAATIAHRGRNIADDSVTKWSLPNAVVQNDEDEVAEGVHDLMTGRETAVAVASRCTSSRSSGAIAGHLIVSGGSAVDAQQLSGSNPAVSGSVGTLEGQRSSLISGLGLSSMNGLLAEGVASSTVATQLSKGRVSRAAALLASSSSNSSNRQRSACNSLACKASDAQAHDVPVLHAPAAPCIQDDDCGNGSSAVLRSHIDPAMLPPTPTLVPFIKYCHQPVVPPDNGHMGVLQLDATAAEPAVGDSASAAQPVVPYSSSAHTSDPRTTSTASGGALSMADMARHASVNIATAAAAACKPNKPAASMYNSSNTAVPMGRGGSGGLQAAGKGAAIAMLAQQLSASSAPSTGAGERGPGSGSGPEGGSEAALPDPPLLCTNTTQVLDARLSVGTAPGGGGGGSSGSPSAALRTVAAIDFSSGGGGDGDDASQLIIVPTTPSMVVPRSSTPATSASNALQDVAAVRGGANASFAVMQLQPEVQEGDECSGSTIDSQPEELFVSYASRPTLNSASNVLLKGSHVHRHHVRHTGVVNVGGSASVRVSSNGALSGSLLLPLLHASRMSSRVVGSEDCLALAAAVADDEGGGGGRTMHRTLSRLRHSTTPPPLCQPSGSHLGDTCHENPSQQQQQQQQQQSLRTAPPRTAGQQSGRVEWEEAHSNDHYVPKSSVGAGNCGTFSGGGGGGGGAAGSGGGAVEEVVGVQNDALRAPRSTTPGVQWIATPPVHTMEYHPTAEAQPPRLTANLWTHQLAAAPQPVSVPDAGSHPLNTTASATSTVAAPFRSYLASEIRGYSGDHAVTGSGSAAGLSRGDGWPLAARSVAGLTHVSSAAGAPSEGLLPSLVLGMASGPFPSPPVTVPLATGAASTALFASVNNSANAAAAAAGVGAATAKGLYSSVAAAQRGVGPVLTPSAGPPTSDPLPASHPFLFATGSGDLSLRVPGITRNNGGGDDGMGRAGVRCAAEKQQRDVSFHGLHVITQLLDTQQRLRLATQNPPTTPGVVLGGGAGHSSIAACHAAPSSQHLSNADGSAFHGTPDAACDAGSPAATRLSLQHAPSWPEVMAALPRSSVVGDMDVHALHATAPPLAVSAARSHGAHAVIRARSPTPVRPPSQSPPPHLHLHPHHAHNHHHLLHTAQSGLDSVCESTHSGLALISEGVLAAGGAFAAFAAPSALMTNASNARLASPALLPSRNGSFVSRQRAHRDGRQSGQRVRGMLVIGRPSHDHPHVTGGSCSIIASGSSVQSAGSGCGKLIIPIRDLLMPVWAALVAGAHVALADEDVLTAALDPPGSPDSPQHITTPHTTRRHPSLPTQRSASALAARSSGQLRDAGMAGTAATSRPRSSPGYSAPCCQQRMPPAA